MQGRDNIARRRGPLEAISLKLFEAQRIGFDGNDVPAFHVLTRKEGVLTKACAYVDEQAVVPQELGQVLDYFLLMHFL